MNSEDTFQNNFFLSLNILRFSQSTTDDIEMPVAGSSHGKSGEQPKIKVAMNQSCQVEHVTFLES